jgi:hypothetical protein
MGLRGVTGAMIDGAPRKPSVPAAKLAVVLQNYRWTPFEANMPIVEYQSMGVTETNGTYHFDRIAAGDRRETIP